MWVCICVFVCACVCVHVCWGMCVRERERYCRQSPPIIVIVEKHKFSLFIYWVTFADVNSPKDTHQNDSSYEDILLGIVYVSPSRVYVWSRVHVHHGLPVCKYLCVGCLHTCMCLTSRVQPSVCLFVCQTDPHLLSSSFVLFLCCLVLTHSVTTVYHTL